MRYTRLGTTDLKTSAVGFGTGSLGEMFGPVDTAQAMAIVAEAIDSGINFFDTAPYYASSEERLGQAMRCRLDQRGVGLDPCRRLSKPHARLPRTTAELASAVDLPGPRRVLNNSARSGRRAAGPSCSAPS